jgi:membrane associated rhomboid family serine protease
VLFPLRDINPTRTTPVLTYAIIAANVLVFVHQLTLGLGTAASQHFAYRYGLVPAYLLAGDERRWLTPFTSMFMHGGLVHLLGNMWFLHIFGDNIEDALGKIRFALFYVACGLAAAAAQVVIDPGSQVPMVGASGAIAGVLAAYMRLYPRARIVLGLWLIVVLLDFRVPAWVCILVWFGFQLLDGLDALHMGVSASGGVAVFAHIGGFLAGMMLVSRLARRRNSTRGFRTPGSYGY